jgi:hypothetical protein
MLIGTAAQAVPVILRRNQNSTGRQATPAQNGLLQSGKTSS